MILLLLVFGGAAIKLQILVCIQVLQQELTIIELKTGYWKVLELVLNSEIK